MRTGDLRRRISIQTRSTTKDSFGQAQLTWTDLLTSVPCQIEGLVGRELIAAQAVNAEVTHQLRLRYHSLLADPVKVAAMRAVYVNEGVTRIFNFAALVNVDERNRELLITATEGLNQG